MVLNNRCKMTFHDPAFMQITHTRGRRIVRRHQPVEMPSKIFCLMAVLHLMPTVSSSIVIPENFTTEMTSERPDLEDSVPLNSTASTIITFIDVPQHTETPLGGSVLLACRTAEPVRDCKWSWTPLPPVNLPHPNVSPSQLASTIEVSSEIIAGSASTSTPSVAVCQFKAFGNNSNDCSVRFTHAKYEQIGYWTCAARSSENDTFISTDPAMLNIASDTLERLITFSDVEDVEAPVGASSQIICRTKTRVSECQWTWRLFNQTELWNLEVKKFPAFGQDQTDCSIKFKNVLAEQEGVWTCGARSDTNATFVQAKPVRFFVLEVEFVQLSRGIQIAAGESALLRCLVDKPVVQCEWSWKPLNSSKAPTVLNKFVPNNDNEHDCSVRFKNVVYEDEGLWTCGVRLTRFGHLHEAPPAKLTLLPSAKINFLELPDNKSVVENSHDSIKCAASNRVSLCTWLWRPLTNEGVEASVMHEFPGLGSLGNNCSLELTKIRIEDEGYWACRVTIATSNLILTSPYAKIIVYSRDKIEFSELSQDIQITSGSSVFLRCVTSSAVEQCRWSLTPVNSNTTVVVKQFPAVGAASRDCSVRLSHALAEQEGLWTCGVKAYGIDSYLNAPPAKLSLLDPDPVSVALWTNPHEKVTLACKLYPLPLDTKCQWIHDANLTTKNTNSSMNKLRQLIKINRTSGICTMELKPTKADLGEWICKFMLETEIGIYELGNASLTILINANDNERLSWIVGSITILILFVMIAVVVMVVFKARLFTSKRNRVFESATPDRLRKMNENAQHNQGPRPETLKTINQATTHDNHQVHLPHSGNSEFCENYELSPCPSKIYSDYSTS